MNFAKKLREIRKENNLTQQNLANFLHVSKFTISHWELEDSFPSIEFLEILADYFDVSIDYLVGRTDELGVIKRENNALTSSENELLSYFRQLDAVKQSKAIGYCYGLLN